MARSGEAARAALIEHAERLFAERGIEGVSLRDVSAAAGQRNHSAAQYHFGDREGLVAAVFSARMREVGRRRQARLEELDRDGRGEETSGWYGRFLARTRWDTLAARVLVDLPEFASYRAVILRIVSRLDGMPLALRRSRADQLLTLVVGTIAGWEWERARGATRLGADALVTELVNTCLGVLSAPTDRQLLVTKGRSA